MDAARGYGLRWQEPISHPAEGVHCIDAIEGTSFRLFPRRNPLLNSPGRRFPTITKVVPSTQPDRFAVGVLPSRFLGDGVQCEAALGAGRLDWNLQDDALLGK